MGAYPTGSLIPFEESKKYFDVIRGHAQFINVWQQHKARNNDPSLWGDESEFIIVRVNDKLKRAQVSLRQAEILQEINKQNGQRVVPSGDAIEKSAKTDHNLQFPIFQKEFCTFMIEALPGRPYTTSLDDLLAVEANMSWRRSIIEQHLKPGEFVVSLSNFPRLGRLHFAEPYDDRLANDLTRSRYLPDSILSPHIAFLTTNKHIMERIGSKKRMNFPVFRDTKTPDPFKDLTLSEHHLKEEKSDLERDLKFSKEDNIFMDATSFGGGCCTIQVTLQAKGIAEARNLYDQLFAITSLMLSLTAATPIFKGYLANTDTCYDICSQSFDDRTADEKQRGIKPRYGALIAYLRENHEESFDDTPIEIDQSVIGALTAEGVDLVLARYIAGIFARDQLLVYEDYLYPKDESTIWHMENLLLQQWDTLKLRTPFKNIDNGADIGWRIEFRPMDIQTTDFENAAFCVFVVLLSRAIIAFNVELSIPISMVDENTRRANTRGSCRKTKFWFRKDIFSMSCQAKNDQTVTRKGTGIGAAACAVARAIARTRASVSSSIDHKSDPRFVELTCDAIINGTSEGPVPFKGLAPLIMDYLETLDADKDKLDQVKKYIDHVCNIANGTTPTVASRIRKFVRAHPDYKFDSEVSDTIQYDLMKRLIKENTDKVPIALL